MSTVVVTKIAKSQKAATGTPSDTQLSVVFCILYSQVCLHNLQPSYGKRSRSSYFPQASLLATFTHTAYTHTAQCQKVVQSKNATYSLHAVCPCVKLQSKQTYGIHTADNLIDIYIHATSILIIGMSLSKPHTTELNGGFFI